MPTKRKPKIGDLVALDTTVSEYAHYPYLKEFENAVGLVTECVGIRCKVVWNNGSTSHPQRSVLEIINEHR